MQTLFSPRPWRFAPSLLAAHTRQRPSHLLSVALAPVPKTRVTESAKGTGGPRSQASGELQPPPDQPQPPRTGLPGASVPSAGLRLRPLSEAAFSHPTPHLLSLTPHLRSSLPPGEPGGAPRLSVMRSAGAPRGQEAVLLSCSLLHSADGPDDRVASPGQGLASVPLVGWSEAPTLPGGTVHMSRAGTDVGSEPGLSSERGTGPQTHHGVQGWGPKGSGLVQCLGAAGSWGTQVCSPAAPTGRQE